MLQHGDVLKSRYQCGWFAKVVSVVGIIATIEHLDREFRGHRTRLTLGELDAAWQRVDSPEAMATVAVRLQEVM